MNRIIYALAAVAFLFVTQALNAQNIPLAGAVPIAEGEENKTKADNREVAFNDGTQGGNGPLTVRFLGTGAADWNGQDERGELRRLSSILLDGRVLIDFTSSDADMLPEDFKAENIFYTHSHNDHYQPQAAVKLGVRRVFVSDSWESRCREDFRTACSEADVEEPEIIPMKIGQKVIIDGLTITALPANHWTRDIQEQTLIYLIEKGTRSLTSPMEAISAGATRLLYATDTGGIMGRAAMMAGIDAHIPDGCPITALIMEATMGIDYEDDFRIYTHSSVGTVLHTTNVLVKTGRYLPAEGQPVWLTHMARTLHGTQAELDRNLPEPLKAAYDGLEIVLGANMDIR